MAQIAVWGSKAFGFDTEKIVPMLDLKVSMAAKDDGNGSEPEVVSFSTQYLRSTNSDPWAQVAEWRSLIGKANILYIGERQFGKNKFTLNSVEVSDVFIGNRGEFIGVKVSLTFEEKIIVAVKATTSGGKYSGKGFFGKLSDTLSAAANAVGNILNNRTEIASSGYVDRLIEYSVTRYEMDAAAEAARNVSVDLQFEAAMQYDPHDPWNDIYSDAQMENWADQVFDENGDWKVKQ